MRLAGSALLNRGASLALFGHSFPDCVTLKTSYGVDALWHQPALNHILTY